MKYLVPSLTAIPGDILSALISGAEHPSILRRGFVVQEYLAVDPANLQKFIDLLNEAGIQFGTSEQQAEFLQPGKAKEIRMMSKSIKIGGKKVTLLQATIKAAGGLSVEQLETPEKLTDEQAVALKRIFESLRPQVKQKLWKLYFEPLATDWGGRVLKRKDGAARSVELDVFIAGSGIDDGPIFINGEIELHGATREEAAAEAARWNANPAQRPPYLALDLTDAQGVKSRDIAAHGPPEFITQALAPYQAANHSIFNQMAKEFLTWADPEVVALVTKSPSELLRSTNFRRTWRLGGSLRVRFESDTPFEISPQDLLDFGAHLPGIEDSSAESEPDLVLQHTASDRGGTHLTQRDGRVSLSTNWGHRLPADFIHLLYGAARKEWIRRGIFPVHAACIGNESDGYILLVGSPGSGKTSLTLNAAARLGLKVFSGDKTLLRFSDDGSLEAISGTRTLTVRAEDIDRWDGVKKVKEHRAGDRLAFELSPEHYSTSPRVKIKKILLVDLNDGVEQTSELTPLSALHTLYPFFMDMQRADVLVGGAQALLDGQIDHSTRTKLSEKLLAALKTTPVHKATASLDGVTDFIRDQVGLEAKPEPPETTTGEAKASRQKNVLVGVCGIGNGHCSRQLPVIRHLLRQGHRVMIFTYGEGLRYFEKRIAAQEGLTIVEVANPYFVGASSGLDFAATARSPKNLGSFNRLNATAMSRAAKEFGKPDLVLSDYELLSAQYAYAKGAPLVTLDQQSKYLVGDFPESLRGTTSKDEQERLSMFFPQAAQRIAVSFFKVPSQRRSAHQVDILPPMIRDEVIAAKGTPKSEKPSILVYVTAQQKSLVGDWAKLLGSELPAGFEAHMFLPRGASLPENTSQIHYYHQGDPRFDSLLASSHGVITTAGHNLLSEAMYLEKPVYALPIPLYEQQLSAHMIAEGGFGINEPELSKEGLNRFLSNLEAYASNIRADQRLLFKQPGNSVVLREIDKRLGATNLRVLANAEPFGFGPAAAIAEIFPFLRSQVRTLGYIGKGHTLDLHRRLSYDSVHDYAAPTSAEERAKFLAVAKDYDVFLTATDFEAAALARNAGLKVIIYDPLTWFWKEVPPQVKAADLYLAQAFVGVRERLQGEPASFPFATQMVPPLVKAPPAGSRSLLLVNLGGLSNPFWDNAPLEAYADFVFQNTQQALTGKFAETVLTTSSAIAKTLQSKHDIQTLLPEQVQRNLADSEIAFMTPGLGNIYEASAYKRRVVWLPPMNDSQGQQIYMLARAGFADAFIDWHEFLDIPPINYFAPQPEVMKELRGAIEKMKANPKAAERFRTLVIQAEERLKTTPSDLKLPKLCEQFGSDGAKCAAESIVDWLRKKE